MSRPMGMPIRVLGSVEVECDGAPVDLGPARQRAVLAVLLLAEGCVVQADDLVGRVWGIDPPPGARAALRSYICRLRQAVAEVPGIRLERAHGGYLAVVDPARLDLARFRRRVTDARSATRGGDDRAGLAAYEDALRSWPGVALAGVTSPWLDDQREALAQERRAAELDFYDLALRLGEQARILPRLITQVADEPFDERLAGQLMLALQASGRASDALGAYERTRRRLRDELGAAPGPELREIHQRVLRAEAPTPRPDHRPPFLVPRQLPPCLAGFVDRGAERQMLDDVLLGSGARIAVVTGTGGVGKTSLAVRWAHQHADAFPDGQIFLDLQGFAPGRRPLSPESGLHAVCVALGADPAALPVELNGLTGVYRSLLQSRRVLLVLDNARTSDQVRPLLPAGLLSSAIITSRCGFGDLLADPGARLVRVGMLEPADARTLLQNRLGVDRVEREEVAVDQLIAHCAGLPLALAIVSGRAALTAHLPLAVLAEELDDETGRLDALGNGEHGPNVRSTLDATVATLPDPASGVFELMGLAPGPSVSAAGVEALTGLSRPRAAAALRALTGYELVEQRRPGRFEMHDLVRLYAADRGRTRPTAEDAVRRLLEHYVAGAAADDATNASAEQSFVATEAPSMLAAVDRAVELGFDALTCDLAVVLADHLASRGCWRELVRSSGLAATAARRLDDPGRLVQALVGVARGQIGLRDFGAASQELSAALESTCRRPMPELEARVHRTMARVAAQQHRHDAALPHDQRALEIHLATGDRTGEANSYNAIGWHQAHLGDPGLALDNCCRALLIFDELGDCSGQALTLDSMGFCLMLLGRSTEALDCYQRAEHLAATLGWKDFRAEILGRLAQSYRGLGRTAEAGWAERQAVEVMELSGLVA